MSIVLLVLAALCLLGAAKVVDEMRKQRAERRALKEQLGADYEAYLELRKRKRSDPG